MDDPWFAIMGINPGKKPVEVPGAEPGGVIPGGKFPMGDIHIGKRAKAALAANNPRPDHPMDFLFKNFIEPHAYGKWDDLDVYNRWLNYVAIEDVSIPIRTVFTLTDGSVIWVITLNRDETPADTIVCLPIEFEVLIKHFTSRNP